MRMPPLKVRRWTRAEYDRLIERGLLDEDDRIELLDGLMVVKEPQGSRHVIPRLGIRHRNYETAYLGSGLVGMREMDAFIGFPRIQALAVRDGLR